jgi:hypothetical protein
MVGEAGVREGMAGEAMVREVGGREEDGVPGTTPHASMGRDPTMATTEFNPAPAGLF